ncbi:MULTISPECIES: helix-turn-helix domain-containing protein [Clostridium]|uniref:helix-turn-helix domain-containing protein n=1 Tax=Clostridium TaxID=1485 RepID=UPI000826D78C|nr:MULTISPECIES: hypothetical protein [Clostridium]PJI07845.1 tetratricopeptide repeat protein [Clostridium sp. CT7]
MGGYEILSVGSKLKKLREKYNVRQDDLAGGNSGDITRNLISQIEHDKANLTKHAAEIMMNNLKKICYKRHIAVDETIEYLMEDEKSQAGRMLDDYIKDLKDMSVYKNTSFLNKLNEVEDFLVNWNLVDKKIIIFELAGDYFSNTNDFYNSSLYYEKARALMDINVYNEHTISILRKLSMIYIYMGKYDEGIRCCDFALNQFKDNISEKYRSIFIFNSAVYYMELKEYSAALTRLKSLENTIKEINMNKYYEVLAQEGVCLGFLGKHQKALNIFNKVLDFVSKDNIEVYILLRLNIVDAYINLNEVDTAKQYLEDILKDIDSISYVPQQGSKIYYEIGNSYKKINDILHAKVYFMKSLDYARTYKQFSIVRNTLNALLDICIANDDNKEINDIKDMFLLNVNREQKMDVHFVNKLVEYYLSKKDCKALEEIQKFIGLYMKGRGYDVL